MRDLAILMATALPKEKLVENLNEAISEWQINKTDENFKHVAFYSQLVLINVVTDGDMKNAQRVMKDMENIEQVSKVFVNNDN